MIILIDETFEKHLKQKGIQKDQVLIFSTSLDEFRKFLEKKNLKLNSIPKGIILDYTQHLVNEDQEQF